MKKLLIFLITIITVSSHLRAGEIVPVWNHPFESTVTDFDIMPGGEEFIITTYEGRLEIRSIVDGSLQREFMNPIKGIVVHNLEITPDSLNILLTVGGVGDHNAGFELRSLEDFSLIQKFELPLEGDIKNEENLNYRNQVKVTKIDPIKPYVYFILKKDINGGQFGRNYDYYSIKVYNYETMEEVIELRKYEKDYIELIDISHDGKYLASINGRESYINVWDLENFEYLKKYKLSQYELNQTWETDIKDLKFSELNNQIIYFSGMFSYKPDPSEADNGVFKYSVDDNDHQKILALNNYSGGLFFIENETILFLNSGNNLLFYILSTESIDAQIKRNTTNSIKNNSIYSSKYEMFIGSSSRGASVKDIRAIRYMTITDIENQKQNGVLIYPNPTTNNVQIETSCSFAETRIELFNINGIILKNEMIPVTDGLVTYDLSSFPSGSYFIRLNCGEEIRTYNVIKEN